MKLSSVSTPAGVPIFIAPPTLLDEAGYGGYSGADKSSKVSNTLLDLVDLGKLAGAPRSSAAASGSSWKTEIAEAPPTKRPLLFKVTLGPISFDVLESYGT
jgi:hypothetical protein